MPNHLPCGCPQNAGDTRTAGSFRLRRSLYSPCCALGLHHHSEARIVISLRGTFKTSHGKHILTVNESAAIYRPPGDEHQDFYPEPAECLALWLPADETSSARQAFVTWDHALSDLSHKLQAEWRFQDSASSLILEGFAILATSIVLHRQPVIARGKPHWIGAIRERLEEQYADPPTLTDLARSVDRDAAYVAATFKRMYGASVGHYVRRLRLWQACYCMQHDKQTSLVEIAQQCGYADQSHFARQFKRLFHITPREYRQRHGS